MTSSCCNLVQPSCCLCYFFFNRTRVNKCILQLLRRDHLQADRSPFLFSFCYGLAVLVNWRQVQSSVPAETSPKTTKRGLLKKCSPKSGPFSTVVVALSICSYAPGGRLGSVLRQQFSWILHSFMACKLLKLHEVLWYLTDFGLAFQLKKMTVFFLQGHGLGHEAANKCEGVFHLGQLQ